MHCKGHQQTTSQSDSLIITLLMKLKWSCFCISTPLHCCPTGWLIISLVWNCFHTSLECSLRVLCSSEKSPLSLLICIFVFFSYSIIPSFAVYLFCCFSLLSLSCFIVLLVPVPVEIIHCIKLAQQCNSKKRIKNSCCPFT